MDNKKDWYKEWFNSPYYDLLYTNRNNQEALGFVANLVNAIKPKDDANVLDIACGEGRFSYQLAGAGLNVIGIDLSAKRVQIAKSLERANLHFYIHDMRAPFRINYFDMLFNFFTSFGYFESNRDNIACAKSFSAGLKKDGMLILDYMNIVYTQKNLKSHEEKSVKNIKFIIDRNIQDGKVIKDIRFKGKDKNDYHYQERVSAFSLSDFKNMFEPVGLELYKVFGDYELRDFDEESSPRLIMVFKKNRNIQNDK